MSAKKKKNFFKSVANIFKFSKKGKKKTPDQPIPTKPRPLSQPDLPWDGAMLNVLKVMILL